MYTFIGNSWLSGELCSHIGLIPCSTPFVNSLILDDKLFVKLCLNLEHYLNIEPVFLDQPSIKSKWYMDTGSEWFVNQCITIPYPVMKIDDLEIHWIYSKDKNTLLEKYKRRSKRLKNILDDPYNNIICVLMFNQLFSEYRNIEEYNDLIRQFFSCKYNTLFIGPSHFKHLATKTTNYYYELPQWNDDSLWLLNSLCRGSIDTITYNFLYHIKQYISDNYCHYRILCLSDIEKRDKLYCYGKFLIIDYSKDENCNKDKYDFIFLIK